MLLTKLHSSPSFFLPQSNTTATGSHPGYLGGKENVYLQLRAEDSSATVLLGLAKVMCLSFRYRFTFYFYIYFLYIPWLLFFVWYWGRDAKDGMQGSQINCPATKLHPQLLTQFFFLLFSGKATKLHNLPCAHVQVIGLGDVCMVVFKLLPLLTFRTHSSYGEEAPEMNPSPVYILSALANTDPLSASTASSVQVISHK